MSNLNLGAGQSGWGHPLQGEFRCGEVSYFDYALSAERGRRMAMQALKANPGRRRQAEQIWGLQYVKNRYPELYATLKDGD